MARTTSSRALSASLLAFLMLLPAFGIPTDLGSFLSDMVKPCADALSARKLLEKLVSGQGITVAAYGGRLTWRNEHGAVPWPVQVFAWLNTTFPNPNRAYLWSDFSNPVWYMLPGQPQVDLILLDVEHSVCPSTEHLSKFHLASKNLPHAPLVLHVLLFACTSSSQDDKVCSPFNIDNLGCAQTVLKSWLSKNVALLDFRQMLSVFRGRQLVTTIVDERGLLNAIGQKLVAKSVVHALSHLFSRLRK